MKIETTKTEKNRELTFVLFEKKQFTRVRHIDKKITEWKNSKTNHFVNAKKFTILESTFKEKSIIVPGHKHVSEVKANPVTTSLSSVGYNFSTPFQKNTIDQEIIKLCEAGTKLGAVKYYKDMTGLGLREAKDYVDALHINFLANKKWDKALELTSTEKEREKNSLEYTKKTFFNENAFKMFVNRVREKAKADGPLSAVKMIKDESGWGLYDSKIFYDYNVKI